MAEPSSNPTAVSAEDNAPCTFCGEPCEPYAGDPSRWPLIFSHYDNTGIARVHHVRCVTDRLFDAERRIEAMREACAKVAETTLLDMQTASLAHKIAGRIRAIPLPKRQEPEKVSAELEGAQRTIKALEVRIATLERTDLGTENRRLVEYTQQLLDRISALEQEYDRHWAMQ